MDLSYMQYIRLFHLLIASVLLFGVYKHSKKEKVPELWWNVVLLLGVGAFGYHGYKLYLSFKN